MTKTTNAATTKTNNLITRGVQAARDGLIGIELDAQMAAEGMPRADRYTVRAAFNAEVPSVVRAILGRS